MYNVGIDKKWQKRWEDTKLHSFNKENADKKLYCLEMFSYPSGANLHVGHWYNFGPTDSWARLRKMQGYEVFQPMGFDAFGLPAENYAISTGIHPHDSTMKNIETMEKQLKEMGGMFDWDYELVTSTPDYYKWTQWIFLKLFKSGLAYRKEAPVNWCPSCQTVLANEQVIENFCERCDAEVEKKNLTQWFFKITDYAEELLEKLDGLDWPEKTKKIQVNWIGKSEGAEIAFDIENTDINFKVFTTRADTLYGITYMVLAPESEIVDKITRDQYRESVEEYKEWAKKQTEIDRLSATKEKTGVFTGAYAIHPLTGERLPIWIADYVLATYGTGCVMAVPAHDERDYEFAEKYELPIRRVIDSADGSEAPLPFIDYGVLVNSHDFNDMASEDAMLKIVERLKDKGYGEVKINYRLRDWLVSRQRYWGSPIPIVYCDKCGTVPVPEEDLPVLLPYDVEFTPDGESPLKKCSDFMNTKCPKCGGLAQRDADTLDTFVCSSWYFLRYPDNKNHDEAWNKDWINKMLPVDQYVGGSEHAAMHLLYARFFTKALRDLGYLDFDEPFLSLRHQGVILGPDGNKMSKSKGNVISPDSYIEEYGSDVFRLYLMFGFAYEEGGPWNDGSIKAIARFLNRIERMADRIIEIRQEAKNNAMGDDEKHLNYERNRVIKEVGKDAGDFHFNTAIARMMELLNAIYKYEAESKNKNAIFFEEVFLDLIRLIAPFAPHFAEEMWETLGNAYSVFNQKWPEWDPEALKKDELEIAVQINGKVRARLMVPSDADTKTMENIALKDDMVKDLLEGKELVKLIAVKGRLLNIVVKNKK